jgi:hypothetical protein
MSPVARDSARRCCSGPTIRSFERLCPTTLHTS